MTFNDLLSESKIPLITMGAAKQQAPALSALSCSLSALSCSFSEEMPWQQLRQAATLTL